MNRVLVSGLVAVLGIAPVAMPLAASARGGGFGMSRGIAVPGGLRGIAPRPIAPIGLSRRPVLRLPVATPILALHRAPLPGLRFHRRFFGRDLPAAGVGVYYGSYGLDNALPYLATSNAPSLPSVGDQAASPRRGCGTETRIVPAEAGGERRITMTYC